MSDLTENTAAEEKSEAPAEASAADIYAKAASFFSAQTVLAVISAAFWIVAVIFSFDKDVGYFASSSWLPPAALAVSASFLLCAVSTYFIIPRGGMPVRIDYSSGLSTASLDFVGFMLLFEGAYRVRDLILTFESKKVYFDRSYLSYSSNRAGRVSVVLSVLAIVFCVTSALYFLLRAAGGKGRRGILTVLGLCVAFRAVAGIGTVYFDMTLAINAPGKLAVELALICVMLWMLLEVRFLLPAEYAKPKLYFTFSLITFAVCFCAGTATAAGYLCGLEKNGVLFIEGVFCLIIGVLVWIRTLLFIRKIARASRSGDGYLGDPECTDAEVSEADPETEENGTDSSAAPDDAGGEEAGITENDTKENRPDET